MVAACDAGITTAPTPAPTLTPGIGSTAPAPSPRAGSVAPAPSEGGPVTDPSVLAGRTFLSTAIAGRQLVPGTQVSLTFANGLSMSAGCNSIGASYAVADGILTTTAGVTTDMACEQPRMDQDTWLAGFVNGAAISLDGATLTLVKDGVTLTLVDEQIANPDKPLEGTTWVVESLIREQAASSVPDGLGASLVFSDGRVAAQTGCNRGNASAVVGSDTILFGPMALTRMACPQPAMDLEAFVTGVLQGSVTYSIHGGFLHLLGLGGGLDLRAQQP